jgi:IS4 transposase
MKKYKVTISRKISIPPGSLIDMNLGYNDSKLFASWTENNIFFAARMKDNADFKVVGEKAPPKNIDALSDQMIQFTSFYAPQNCPHLLRRIVVWDNQNNREQVLLTNHFKFIATTISEIYKDWWQIWLLFKELKKNLRIKTLVGTSESSHFIQIWKASIAMLLIKLLQFKSKFRWFLSNLVAFLRSNRLFSYRDLWECIDNPFDILPVVLKPVQISLSFMGP